MTETHRFTLTWRFASASPFKGEGWGEGARLNDRYNFVIALVQRRPDEIVHAGIDDSEFFTPGLLDVTNAREQNAGVADKKTARLDKNPNTQIAQRRHNCISVIAHTERGRFAGRDRATICLIRSPVRAGK